MDLPIVVYVLIAKHCAPRDAASLFQVSRTARRAHLEYYKEATTMYEDGVSVAIGTYETMTRPRRSFRIVLTNEELYIRLRSVMIPLMSSLVVPMRWMIEPLSYEPFHGKRCVNKKLIGTLDSDCLVEMLRVGYITIKNVEYQNRWMCLAAVKRRGYAIQHCRFKTSEIRLAAIMKRPADILFCDEISPTNEEIDVAISFSTKYFSWFKKLPYQPLEACKRIISLRARHIGYVRNQTYELGMFAAHTAMEKLRRDDQIISMATVFSCAFWSELSDDISERVETDIANEILSAKRAKVDYQNID